MKEYILISKEIANKLSLNTIGIAKIEGIIYNKVYTKDFIGLLNEKIELLQEDINDTFLYLAEYADDYISSQTIEEVKKQTDPNDLKLELGELVYKAILNLDNSLEYDAGFVLGLIEGKKIIENLITKFK